MSAHFSKSFSGENMKVQMKHRLPRIFAVVSNNTVLFNAQFGGNGRNNLKNMSNNYAVLWSNIRHAGMRMRLRNNKKMNRSLRLDIIKCENQIVLVQLS